MLPPNAQKGFTLVELLIVIAIIGIISAFALPNFLTQLKKMEAKTVATSLRTSFSHGKQTALIYQKSVTFCVANDNLQCVIQNGNHLLLFIDNNQNQRYDVGTDFLHEQQKLQLNFGSLITSISLNKPYIELKPINGRPIGYMGHIKYCPKDNNSEFMFKISFSRTGIIKQKFDKEEATNC